MLNDDDLRSCFLSLDYIVEQRYTSGRVVGIPKKEMSVAIRYNRGDDKPARAEQGNGPKSDVVFTGSQ